MKTIGLIGGMSWESSIKYYKIINEEVNKRLGGTHSAKCIMVSVDFDEIERLQNEGKWEELAVIMIDCAKTLELSGADCIVICTNTMHKIAEQVENEVNIPLIHIADATAKIVKEENIANVGLLGTNFTMDQDFYKRHLINHNLNVIIPSKSDRDIIHDIIYKELVLGIINPDSHSKYIEIINKLTNNGAEGIILGCTEIGLLIDSHDTESILFDTTKIHSIAAVEFALDALND